MQKIVHLHGGVYVAKGAEGVGRLHQAALGEVEVRVALDEAVLGVGVELVEGLLDKGVDITVGGGELGDPDVVLAARLVDLDKVLEEQVGAGIAAGSVPVGVAAVHGAVGATGLHEGAEPRGALAGGLAAGDGGSEDLGLADEGLHEGLVGGGSRGGVHVALAGVVALVEAEEGVGTGRNGLLGVLSPAFAMHGRGSPEGGDVSDGSLEAVRVGAPVVGPTELVAGGADVGDELGVVVGETATMLAALASGRRGGGIIRGDGRGDSGRNLAGNGGRGRLDNGGLGGEADHGLLRGRGSLGGGHHGGGLGSGGLLNRSLSRSDNGSSRGRGGGNGLDGLGIRVVTLVGDVNSGDRRGRRSGAGGSGGGQVALGDVDGHNVSDNLDLGGDVIPSVVHVAVVVGSLHSEQVGGAEGRDDVLGEHICKGYVMSGYQGGYVSFGGVVVSGGRSVCVGASDFQRMEDGSRVMSSFKRGDPKVRIRRSLSKTQRE